MLTLKDLHQNGWESGINQVVMADCLEAMKLIPDKSIDLILTDPPYGISYNAQKSGLHKNAKVFKDIKNDTGNLDLSFLFHRKELLIMFGANNFCTKLPHAGNWLCWDKRVTEGADLIRGSAFELAWVSSSTGKYKIYRIQHGGAINADAIKPGQHLQRSHPTQKPVELIRQILLDYTKPGDLVCDPFMGSWTTARACKDLGRDFIGFELEEDYCKVGEERLRQENLF